MAGSSSAPVFEPAPRGREPTEGLQALRSELLELAFALDRKGRADAADLAISVAHRINELLATAEARDAGLELGPASAAHSPFAR